MTKPSFLPRKNILTWCFLFFAALQAGLCQSHSIPDLPTPLKKPVMRISVQNGKILQQDRGFLMTTNEEGNIFKSTRTVSVEYG